MTTHTHEGVSHRRRLPHLQAPGRAHFVTFCTRGKRALPTGVRHVPIDCCRELDGAMFCLHGVVVMPDHVHLVATPLSSPGGEDFLLSDILRLIKGRSARRINRELGCSGAVWQAESFDHVLRSDESAESKVDYLLMNPVRRRLVTSPEKYPWTWRRTVEPDGTARVDGGHVAQASACGRSDGVRGG